MCGLYNHAAIASCFSKKTKYPENPSKTRELKRTDFTEEEKENYVNILFGQLDTMKKSFEKTRKEK